MAEELGSLAVKIGLDSSGFQNGISEINRQMKVLDSEFKANTSALGENAKGVEGLRLKADNLSKSMDLQRQKISALETAYYKSVETKGKDAKATQELEIKLNNARTALNKMDTELSNANKQLENASTKTGLLSKAQEKLGINIGSLKTAFGAIGVAAGSYLKSAVDSATNTEKSTRQLTNLLKNQGLTVGEAGAKIKEFQKTITDMSSYSGGEAREALQTLTQKGLEVGNSLKFAGTIADVAAGSNRSLSDAADLVADAYNGKARALVSLGILTKEEVKGLGDSEKATISMEEVQRRLNAQFGGAAQEELNSYSGKLKENENTIKSAKTAIGTAMLPVLAQLADAFSKALVPIAEFIKQNPNFTAAVLSIVAVLGTLIGGLSVFNTVTTAMGTMGIAFKGIGLAAGASIAPMLAAIAAVTVVSFAAYEIINHWSEIKIFFTNLWTGIKSEIELIWTGIVLFFNSTWNSIKNTVQETWNGIKATISNGLSDVKSFLEPALKLYETIFTNTWSIIKNIFLGSILIIIDLVTGNFKKLKTDMESIWNNIKTSMDNIWISIRTLAINAWNNFKIAIMEISTGIANGIVDIWTGLLNYFSNLPGVLFTYAVNMFTSMKNGVLATIGGVSSAITTGFNGAISFITGLPSKALQWGKDFIQGLINGIKSMMGGITSAVTSVADKIRSLLHFSTPDEGPLKDYESWMPDFMAGLAEGINNSKYLVAGAMNRLTMDMNLNSIVSSSPVAAAGPNITILNQGTIVGSNGMKEFAKIVSKEIGKDYGASTGGGW